MPETAIDDLPKFDAFLIGVQAIDYPINASDFYRYKDGFEPVGNKGDITRNVLARAGNSLVKLVFCDQTLEAYLAAEATDRAETLDWLKKEGRERKLYASVISAEEFKIDGVDVDHPYQLFWRIPRTWFPAEIAITKVFTQFAEFFDSPLNIDMIATPDDEAPNVKSIWSAQANA